MMVGPSPSGSGGWPSTWGGGRPRRAPRPTLRKLHCGRRSIRRWRRTSAASSADGSERSAIQRESLLAMLETLAPPEWNTQSLCAEWRIRDVVGHLVSETTMTISKLVRARSSPGFRSTSSLPATPAAKATCLTKNSSTLSGLLFLHARTSVGSHRCPCSKAS